MERDVGCGPDAGDDGRRAAAQHAHTEHQAAHSHREEPHGSGPDREQRGLHSATSSTRHPAGVLARYSSTYRVAPAAATWTTTTRRPSGARPTTATCVTVAATLV